MKLRKLALTLHGYVGVAIGLLLVIIGLTGSSIVFHEEIDRALNPHLMQVVPQGKPVSIDAVLEPVLQANPDSKLQSIQLPQPDATYLVRMKSSGDRSFEFYVNPYTAAILGSRQRERALMGFLYNLHYQLLAGDVGSIVVGICGLFLILLGITGLVLWTGWKRLIAGFKIRTHAPRPLINYDLHKVAGIVSVLFLLVLGFTGSFIIVLQQSPSLFMMLLGTPPKTEQLSALKPNQPPIPLSQLLQTADAALPEGKTTFISFSGQQEQQVQVRKKLPQDTLPIGLSTVDLDRYSGKFLSMHKVENPTIGTRLVLTITALHFGTFGGLPTRILYVFVGLTPAILFVTGLVLWQRRRWAEARKKEAIRHGDRCSLTRICRRSRLLIKRDL